MTLARKTMGRRTPLSMKASSCSTSPSRGVKPIRSCHFCQRTACPSTVKLGPSGWVIVIGLTSSRYASTAGTLSSANSHGSS